MGRKNRKNRKSREEEEAEEAERIRKVNEEHEREMAAAEAAEVKVAKMRHGLTLRLSIKFDSLEHLRTTIAEAEASEQADTSEHIRGDVGAERRAALEDARERVAWLATAELERAMLRRQLPSLLDAIAEAEEEGVVDAAVLARARALATVLEAEPPCAEAAPVGTHGANELLRPHHIDCDAIFSPFMHCADKTTTATHDYKFWGGDSQPWRHGLDDTPVTDPTAIASEEQHKLAAEAEDKSTAGTPAHAVLLRCCGVRIDFLLALTFALNLWEWRTWEVVQYLVKPVTECEQRCRFVDLQGVRPFAGAATVFISHCWGGRWGDLVAAACASSDTRRVVWIDVFAVRQWPGNGADLDFRGVLTGCTAAIVAAVPIEGKLTNSDQNWGNGQQLHQQQKQEFLESSEYSAAAKVLPFARLWCVVEIAAVLELGKALVFSSGRVGAAGHGAVRVPIERGTGAVNMLVNCSHLVNVEGADAAVEADKVRELAKIGPDNFGRINQAVASALYAGSVAVRSNVTATNAASCGESWSVGEVAGGGVGPLVLAASVAGSYSVLVELWAVRRAEVEAYLAGAGEGGEGRWHPVWIAAFNGQQATVEWLTAVAGAEAGAVNPTSSREGLSALHVAVENDHAGCVAALVEAGADMEATLDCSSDWDDGDLTALQCAAQGGHLRCMEVLLERGCKVWARSSHMKRTALHLATEKGHVSCVELLLDHARRRHANRPFLSWGGDNVSMSQAFRDWGARDDELRGCESLGNAWQKDWSGDTAVDIAVHGAYDAEGAEESGLPSAYGGSSAAYLSCQALIEEAMQTFRATPWKGQFDMQENDLWRCRFCSTLSDDIPPAYMKCDDCETLRGQYRPRPRPSPGTDEGEDTEDEEAEDEGKGEGKDEDEDEDEAELARVLKLSLAGGDDEAAEDEGATPHVTSFAAVLGMEPVDLAKLLDVDALVEHCGGSVEAALDMYLNNHAQCRKVAPPNRPKGDALLVPKQQGAAEEQEGAAAGLGLGSEEAADGDGDGAGQGGNANGDEVDDELALALKLSMA